MDDITANYHGGNAQSEAAHRRTNKERDWSEVARGTKTTPLKDRGNAVAYLVARLRRDGHDALAERVVAGEISARAAAIEAGIITPDTPLTLLRRAWARASDEEREIFRQEIE